MSDSERLVAFVLAGIKREEAAARAAYEEASDYRLVGSELAELHFVNWKPDRVLAECAAKRRIVDDYREAEQLCGRDHNEAGWSAAASALERVMRLLAQPYAGADGWDEAWKVET